MIRRWNAFAAIRRELTCVQRLRSEVTPPPGDNFFGSDVHQPCRASSLATHIGTDGDEMSPSGQASKQFRDHNLFIFSLLKRFVQGTARLLDAFGGDCTRRLEI